MILLHVNAREDQLIEWMTKGQAMALRINVLRYKGFVFRQQSPILWEKTGPLHLALVGLTAGWQAGWQAGRLADEIGLDFKILKILYRLNYFDFYFVYSSAMLLIVLEVHFSLLFPSNAYFRVCFVVCKIWLPFFSCWSLLLGTTVPNGAYKLKKINNRWCKTTATTLDTILIPTADNTIWMTKLDILTPATWIGKKLVQ